MTSGIIRRNTKQREVILAELRRLPNHPSAAQLFERVRPSLPRVSLGTVYRNLELLAQGGVIKKIPFGKREARYDGTTAEHYHVQCTRCGRVADVPPQAVSFSEERVEQETGFEVSASDFKFVGLCSGCRRSDK
jgi:Fur family transcriptional regulator, ferric uptake regulator